MTIQRKRSTRSGRGLLFGYFRRERGNTAALMALLLVPLIGAISMGVETANWFFLGRAAQNAADSAAIAAANNGSTAKVSGTTDEFVDEGLANTQKYGFTNNVNNVNVSIQNGQKCPDGTTGCYSATVTKLVPVYLTALVGFRGDTTIGTARAKTITGIALAESINVGFPSCITALGSDTTAPNGQKTAIAGDGTPTSNAPECSISAVGASPSTIGCTGNNGLGAPDGFATGFSPSGNHKCTTNQTVESGSFTFCNPYATGDPAGCPAVTYPSAITSAVSGASGTMCPGSANGNGKKAVWDMSSITASCTYAGGSGNLTLTGSLSPTTPMVVVVSGGASLDMNGFSSSNITWIFTAGSASTPGTLTGTSNLSITAPNAASGSALSGIAVYQVTSSACTSASNGCDNWSVSGNTTVQVTGLLYLPYTNGSYGGSVTQSSTGNCFISVFNTFSDNGTGLLLDETGCTAAGLGSLPQVQRSYIALVQ